MTLIFHLLPFRIFCLQIGKEILYQIINQARKLIILLNFNFSRFQVSSY
jgi:hypothetical protein